MAVFAPRHVLTPDGERIAARPVSGSDSGWKPFYRVGGSAALATVALVVLQAPILILNPIPTTIAAHFAQLQSNKLIGLIDLDLVFLVSEVLSLFVLVGIYAALRRSRPVLTATALGLAIGSLMLYLAVNPTFSLLYLSDQYAAATTGADKAAFLAAGNALWANYQGTAFAMAFILGGASTLIMSIVMLRTGIFNRWTAYLGLVVGATMLVPPLPVLGTVAVVVAYASLLPLVAWELLVGVRLFRLAR